MSQTPSIRLYEAADSVDGDSFMRGIGSFLGSLAPKSRREEEEQKLKVYKQLNVYEQEIGQLRLLLEQNKTYLKIVEEELRHVKKRSEENEEKMKTSEENEENIRSQLQQRNENIKRIQQQLADAQKLSASNEEKLYMQLKERDIYITKIEQELANTKRLHVQNEKNMKRRENSNGAKTQKIIENLDGSRKQNQLREGTRNIIRSKETLMKMKIVELKASLKEKGLAIGGNKQTLVQRLLDSFDNGDGE